MKVKAFDKPSLFGPYHFFKQVLTKVADVMFEDFKSRQAKFKMCFATLSRQASVK
jgi:hypothetical protein